MLKISTLLASAPIALSAAATPQAPLLPTGKWMVHAEESLCALSHRFGSGDSELVVGFQPVFIDDSMEVIAISHSKSQRQYIDHATLRFDPGGKSISGRYFSVPTEQKGQRYTRITISREVFDRMQLAKVIEINAAPVRTAITMPAAEKAVAVFRACESSLLRSWKIDPAAVAPDREAKAINPGRAFGSNDYPLDALMKGHIGRVVAVVQVDATGKPTACRAVVGVAASLNEATCKGAMRVKYKPGKDEHGNTAPSLTVLAVNWQR